MGFWMIFDDICIGGEWWVVNSMMMLERRVVLALHMYIENIPNISSNSSAVIDLYERFLKPGFPKWKLVDMFTQTIYDLVAYNSIHNIHEVSGYDQQ